MKEKTRYLDGRLIVCVGDITTFTGEAIVNAANSSLLGGGGVDGAIHRAGGPAILEACRAIRETRYPDGLPAGNAVATTAGILAARHVIHTVGPVWRDGSRGEDDVLASAYRASLETTTLLEAHRVAFPAISTGVYGFPKDRAARIAYDVVRDYLAGHDLPAEVTMAFFSDSDARTFAEALA
jgi:O-acetyl-ADP-ribose deacetylase